MSGWLYVFAPPCDANPVGTETNHPFLPNKASLLLYLQPEKDQPFLLLHKPSLLSNMVLPLTHHLPISCLFYILLLLLLHHSPPCNATRPTPGVLLTSPKCHNHTCHHIPQIHVSRHYVYFPGEPRWARQMPMTLTYAFSPENLITFLPLTAIREVFARAFSRWGAVIPAGFNEVEDYYTADIKIGFYRGDHGDGQPFDGVLGVLAHSFSPESGTLHLDADERWAVDFNVEKSKVAVDLESVALHEIGHVLGLAHTDIEGAVMYPSLKPRKRKLELSVDDIKGVQALYGSNPNFTFGSLSSESDISTSQADHPTFITLSKWANTWIVVVLTLNCFVLLVL